MATDNTVKSADLAVQEVDFVEGFAKDLKDLSEVLGLIRKEEVPEGHTIEIYRANGTIESGDVEEGADIPLSKIGTEIATTLKIGCKQWNKLTTKKAINEKGYWQAVTTTDNELKHQVQGDIRSDLFAFLKTGTGTATGEGLQQTLSATWAKLLNLWGDFGAASSDFLYFVNPEDAADWLGKAQITTQTAFGMQFIQNFLGLYEVVTNPLVQKGKVYATHKNNIIMAYANPAGAENPLQLTTDETGLVGIAHAPIYTKGGLLTYVTSGVKFYSEYLNKLVVASITEPTPAEISTK